MPLRSQSRVRIAGTVPEVWAYVATSAAGQNGRRPFAKAGSRGGAPLQPGSRVEQRAKLVFGATRHRAQDVTLVEAPRRLAFAGPMGTSAARWGMELEPAGEMLTEAVMWVEVDLKNVMRAIPGRVLNDRIRRVMDVEMAAIKAAVESAVPGGSH